MQEIDIETCQKKKNKQKGNMEETDTERDQIKKQTKRVLIFLHSIKIGCHWFNREKIWKNARGKYNNKRGKNDIDFDIELDIEIAIDK